MRPWLWTAGVLALTVLVELSVITSRTPAHAQELCRTGPIGEIEHVVRKPLQVDGNGDDGLLGWLLGTANAVHVGTRAQTIEWELLFERGDCFDPVRLAESERMLRDLRYISDARISAEQEDDGTYRVTVEIQDAWALTWGLGVALDNGVQITGVSANARNLLGTGTWVGLFRTEYRERRRTGLIARQPNLFGSRIDGTLHGGETRSGRYVSQSLFRPYSGEIGTIAVRQAVSLRDDVFAYSTDAASGFSQALVRFEEERYELTLQRRWGRRGGTRLVGGLGASVERLRFWPDPTGILAVTDDDFASALPAPRGFASTVEGQVRNHSATRVNFTVGVRNAAFEARSGLDALRASQDVMVGASLIATVSPSIFDGSGGSGDILFGARAAWGLGGTTGYSLLEADLQSRRERTRSLSDNARWRDVVYRFGGTGYWLQADRLGMFAKATYVAGYSLDRPFQLTLGGREGVRGYGDDAFPGARRLHATLEQRFRVDALRTPLADVGLAVFVDGGRSWAGSAPFGTDSGWKSAAGAGLRLGAPAGSASVLRVDLAVPIGSRSREPGVVFRIYTELFGLLDRRAWPTQPQRSRWYGIDPDLTTRPFNPLARN